MIKVLFLINTLGGGGAERVLINLVNNMDLTKYDITVQVIFKGGVNRDSLRPEVHYKEIDTPFFKGISRIFKHIPARMLYRHYIKEHYDVVIAYMHGLPTRILQGKPKGTRSIAWLHYLMSASSLPKFFYPNQIIPAFDTFDKIVGVGKTVSDSFVQMYGLAEKVVTCYNTNDVPAIHRLSSENLTISGWNGLKDNLRLVTVGRLGPEKGFDRLLNCCAKLRDDGLHFKMLIIGQGSEETKLKELQHNLHLENTVIFGGYKANPFPYVKNADLFVVSSRQEGLQTAMCEALILGTPVISTLVSGAAEVLGENSEYGLVVDNDDKSLYEGLKQLLTSPELLAHYRMKAKERASFFEPSKTVKAVEDLIDSVAKGED